MTDIEQNSCKEQGGKQIWASITDERQRESFGREKSANHKKVDDDLQAENGGRSERKVFPESIRSVPGNPKSSPDEQGKNANQYKNP